MNPRGRWPSERGVKVTGDRPTLRLDFSRRNSHDGNVFVSSPKRQARLAGALYLVVILAGMFAEAFVRPRIVVAGDAAATARHLLAHAQLYRVGLLTDLLTVVAAVAEGVLVYYLFRPVGRFLALTSLLIALVSNAGEVVAGLIHLLPLVILHGVQAMSALSQGQLEELALLALRTHNEFLGITLAIFSFALCIDGYLVYVSTFVPKVIGVFLIIASACYLINSVAIMLDLPLGPLNGLILIPAFLGELSFCLWLLVRGVDEPRWRAVYAASSAQGS